MNRFVSATYDVVVIGSGVAGLTAAAMLSDRGMRTLAIERHNVPGGCASFYQKSGYRFDVGATLVSGFGPRGVHRHIFEMLRAPIEVERIEPAMVFHFADETLFRYGDERWPRERLRVFGPQSEPFWHAQEHIADLAWDFSTKFPALPVDRSGLVALARAFRPRHLPLVATLGRTVASIIPTGAPPRLRAFLDAQLLITAQTDAASADLAYGATALDIAREGTFHLPDGVSTIATTLARCVRRAGSAIAYGREVRRILMHHGRGGVRGVELDDGSEIACERIVSALPLEGLLRLCPELRGSYRRRVAALPERWGAYMAYVGLPAGVVPEDLAAHHQLMFDQSAPLGEGNTVFLSFSGATERRRARDGGRAVTISTHTDVARWERAAATGTLAQLRATYRAALTSALERVVPGAAARAVVFEDATPLTFERFTGRARGLVGGLPQTPAYANLHAFSHRTPVRGLFACGDTTFPGQSTVGTSLSGVAAAQAVLLGGR